MSGIKNQKLREAWDEYQIAYFRGELILMDPDGYSQKKKWQTIEEMLKAKSAVDNAMREMFWETPECVRAEFFKSLLELGYYPESEWRWILNYWD